jgi:two-component system response regulator
VTTSSGTFNILLIDNDDDDRILFATALKESGLKAELFEAKDGYAGLNYIFGDGQYSDRHKFPVPNIVFLDVKMLGIDGFAVLGRIRSVPKTKSLPVIMLSNSDLASDVQAAYLSGANAFHRKPGTYRALVDLLRTILTPWKDVNFRPPHYKSGETQWKQIMHKIR